MHYHALPSKEMNCDSVFLHSQFNHTLILLPAIAISTCSMQVIFLVWIFSLLPVWKAWISRFRTITTFWLWKAASAVKNTDNFLPSETLDSVMLIYIYVTPFIPEDPNALYKLTLSVHRSCTNIHSYINRHSNPITDSWNASLYVYSQHIRGKSALHTLHRITIKEENKAAWFRGMPFPCRESARNLGKQQNSFTAWATDISLALCCIG